jgi:hypothetical protein
MMQEKRRVLWTRKQIRQSCTDSKMPAAMYTQLLRCERPKSWVGLHDTLEKLDGAPLRDEISVILEGHPLLGDPWVEIPRQAARVVSALRANRFKTGG